jgi:hypothetical protein
MGVGMSRFTLIAGCIQANLSAEEVTALQSRLDALAGIVGGKSWGLDRGKPRIYLPSAKERGLRAAAAIIALDEELSDDQINQAAHESTNGRAEEAYEILGIVA